MENSKMVLTLLAACSLGLLTTGCSSVNEMVHGEKAMVEVAESDVDELQIPKWFLYEEKDNSKVITVTSTEVSKDMQFAIDKAELQARVQLAQKIGAKVQSIVKESTLESGYGVKDVDTEIDRVSKTSTNQTIAFYRRENLKIVKEGDHYRAFVKLTLDVAEGRRLTDKTNTKSRIEAFKELDEEINVTNGVEIVEIQPET